MLRPRGGAGDFPAVVAAHVVDLNQLCLFVCSDQMLHVLFHPLRQPFSHGARKRQAFAFEVDAGNRLHQNREASAAAAGQKADDAAIARIKQKADQEADASAAAEAWQKAEDAAIVEAARKAEKEGRVVT